MSTPPAAPPAPPAERATPPPAAPRRSFLVVAVAIVAIFAIVAVAAVSLTGGGGDTTPSGQTGDQPKPKIEGIRSAPAEQAADAHLIDPVDAVVGPDGSVYVVEFEAHRVRKVTPDGDLVTVAGIGRGGYDGDGGKATDAQLLFPTGAAVSEQGVVYIADSANKRVRRVAKDGTITTFAGDGTVGQVNEGGPATRAGINPFDVAVGPHGSVYIASPSHKRVFVVRNGKISTFAGTGAKGSTGDGGQAKKATLTSPSSVAVGPDGSVYISDFTADVVRKVGPRGIISTVAGGGTHPGDDVVKGPDGLSVADDGTVYVALTSSRRVASIDKAGVHLVAGTGERGVADDGAGAATATLADPSAAAVTDDGTVVIAESYANRVRTVKAGTLGTLAGRGPAGAAGDNLPADEAPLSKPQGVNVDLAGNVYVAEGFTGRLRSIDTDGIIHTIAGGTVKGDSPLVGKPLDGPTALLLGAGGDVFFTQIGDSRVRVIRNGQMFLIAGNGTPGYSGDTGPAGQAQLNGPLGLGLTADGGLVVADAGNGVIRKIGADSMVSTIAGTGASEDGPATGRALEVSLNFPIGVVVRPDGGMYVSEGTGNRIRLIKPDGTVVTVAGTGKAGGKGDGGPAKKAQLDAPAGLALSPDGALYVAEQGGNRVRRIAKNGTITTVAGTGEAGFSGDGKAATDARLYAPSFVAVDLHGTLYVSDTGNGRVRKIAEDGTITTFAGF